jgi:predicted acylesterase/phospholipase RssA
MYKPDDKSAVKEYCKNEDEQSPFVSDDRINPLVQVLEPQLHPSLEEDYQTSTHTNFFIPRIPPRILAFSGGGALCLAHVGVLKSLSSHGLLSSIKECVGISAGAIISLLYVLGYTLDEIERLGLALDFTAFAPRFEPDMLLSLYTTWGLDTGHIAERFIRSLFTAKGMSPDSTFADLGKRGMRLRCYATEINSSSMKEFSYTETPHTQVAFAIRATISIPLLFTPVRDTNGSIYVDGGIIHNTPLPFLKSSEIIDTLCVHLDTSHIKMGDINAMDACKSLYSSLTKIRNDSLLKKYSTYIINVPLFGEIPIRDVYPLEYKNRLIKIGYAACERFLQKKIRPPRRFSAS